MLEIIERAKAIVVEQLFVDPDQVVETAVVERGWQDGHIEGSLLANSGFRLQVAQ